MNPSKSLFWCAVALLVLFSCEKDDSDNSGSAYDDAYYAAHATISSTDAHFTTTDDGGAISFKTTGGEVVVNVSCGTAWSAQNSASDLFGCDQHSSTITVTAGQNLVEEELSGTITLMTAEQHIKFATIAVTQNAYGAPEIRVDTNEWHAPATGDLTLEIAVEATDEWGFESSAEWLTVEKSERGIILTAAENADVTERVAEVVLTCTDGITSDCEIITVTQSAYPLEITAGTNEWHAPAIGDLTLEIAVEATDEWGFENSAEWLTVEKSETSIILTVAENADTTERIAELILACTYGTASVFDTITVIQDGLAYITLGEEELSLSKSGSTISVPVESNFDWEYTCESDWLSVAKNEQDGSLTITYTTNETGNDRESIISITAGDGARNTTEAQLRVTQSYQDLDALILEYTITSTSGNNTSMVALPISGFQGTIDWDDGLTSSYSSETNFPSHKYSTAGAFNISITGTVTKTKFTQRHDDYYAQLVTGYERLTAVVQWGNILGIKSMDGAFREATGLASVAESKGSFSNVTTFEDMFYGCTALTTVPENMFANCSAATSFYRTFYGCTALTTVPENMFANCSAVTSFYRTFYGCSSLTTVPENLFANCSAVTSFEGAFRDCSAMKTIPIGLFDNNSLVTNFSYTFGGCSSVVGESPYIEAEVNGEWVKVHLYQRSGDNAVSLRLATPKSYTECFRNATFSDMESIPSGWK